MTKETNFATDDEAAPQNVWKKYWWVLAVVVLIVLITIIYLLSHLSAADSEMYPTTMLWLYRPIAQLC